MMFDQNVKHYSLKTTSKTTFLERDMGGLPFWLLQKNPDVKLRTNDPKYMFYVDRFLGQLYGRLSKHLIQNGGPIILVQIENEYGSYVQVTLLHNNHTPNTGLFYICSWIINYDSRVVIFKYMDRMYRSLFSTIATNTGLFYISS